MNTFGRLLRVSIFGESHGPCVGALIDGCPAGLDLSIEEFATDLRRRQAGRTGTTSRREEDVPRFEAVNLINYDFGKYGTPAVRDGLIKKWTEEVFPLPK